MVFYHTRGGGDTPQPNYFCFFPRGKKFHCFKMIYMLWNMKKKIGNFFSPIMTPPPSIPFRRASKMKNISFEDFKEKHRLLVLYRILFITCRLSNWNVPEKNGNYHTFKTSLKGGGTSSMVKDHTISGFSYEGFL